MKFFKNFWGHGQSIPFPHPGPGMDGVDVDQPIGNTLSESRIYFVAFWEDKYWCVIQWMGEFSLILSHNF